MKTDDLYHTFHADEVDEAELHHIMLSHFKSGTHAGSDVIFPADEERYAIKVLYRKGLLKNIVAGPALTPEDIGAIRSIIEAELQPLPERVGTQVLFSSYPVNGWFRYKDRFQVLPVPTDAPRPGHLWGANHPFLLQFRYKPSSQPFIGYSRKAAQGQRLQLLLTGLLVGNIHSLSRYTVWRWVLPQFDSDMSGPLVSSFRQEGYEFESLKQVREADDFSSVSHLHPLQSIDSEDYYTRFAIDIAGSDGLMIPATLIALLDKLFALSAEDQDSFLRCCFWLRHSFSVFSESTSAVFTALISAIEALIPPEPLAGECPLCKRRVGKGSTRRLADFLDHYAPATPKLNAARAALFYQFRSSLSHGGQLAYSDRRSVLAGITPESSSERDLLLHVWHLVRVVLVNWLHSRPQLLIPTYTGPLPPRPLSS